MELIAGGLALARRRDGCHAGGRGAADGRARGRARSAGCPGSAIASTPPIRACKVLFDMARAEGVAGDGIRFMEALEAEARARIKPLPMNIDGALAAMLHDMGFPPPAGKFIFIIGRVAGLTAEVAEEYAAREADADQVRRWSTTARRPSPSRRHMARTITAEETAVVHELVGTRARRDGARSSTTTRRRSIACAAPSRWAGGNEPTAIRLANMSVDESGMGRREPTRRAKVLGILRDALRQKSMGIIEEDPVARHREVRQARRRDRRR